jgi:hypothetical protein
MALLSTMAWTTPAEAFRFNLGDVQGSLDSTLSFGMSWRMSDQDKEIIGTSNGGYAHSVNGDDGNLNYKKNDPISQTYKITSDLQLDYKNFGLFMRGTAFYDHENYKKSRDRTELSDDAIDLVGKDAELLDAYVWWNFDLGEMPGQLRLGDQVVSWGESTFIQNSINTINPIDVSKFRLPGSELKEALVPVGMVSGSLSINDYLSLEGFYQYKWEKTEIDPTGYYWSSNDFAGEGGSKVMLGFGAAPDSLPPGIGTNAVVPRGQTQYAKNGDQFGVALRAFVPQLNDTELGLYFINYHSRLPIISARTGTIPPWPAGDYVGTGAYFTEYPEDIQLYGVSFNTQLSGTGIALQGEYSYRKDVPLQIDDVEILYAALSPINPALGINQLGPYTFNQEIQGYKEMDVSQAQMTATKVFGPSFGANQWVVVGEVGVTHVHNMPSKDKLRFEAPGTYTSGNNLFTLAGAQPATEKSEAFADDTSWGYRVVTKLDYNDAIGAVTLSPRIAWAHDVDGNSPGPGGNFVEHRKAITFGVNADYQKTWSADLSYTDFFGAGRYNLANDRDVLALNVKYSF